MSDEKTARKIGWYWVRGGSMIATYPWDVAYWDGFTWRVCGVAGKVYDEYFLEIDERPIEREVKPMPHVREVLKK